MVLSRFVPSSGRVGHCDTGSAFVPPIALWIAAEDGVSSQLAMISSYSRYTRRFFAAGLTAALEAGALYFFADFRSLNEAEAIVVS